MKRLPISLAVAALLASPLAMAKTVDAVASFSILGDIVKQVGAITSRSARWWGRMAIRTVSSLRRRTAKVGSG